MENIAQLNQARSLVEQDNSLVPQVVDSVLSIQDNPEPAVRRWCSLFLLDAFTIFDLDPETLQSQAVKCLDGITQLLGDDDKTVLKNTIMLCGTIYPVGFKHMCENPQDSGVWEKVQQIKQRCKELWNTHADNFTIESACIKFGSQVVKTQSYPGNSADPRVRNNRDDVSMASIPPGHFLAQDPRLEGEREGLLDRLLGVFSNEVIYAPKITCTIHAVNSLVRTRPSTAPKILNALFKFDSSQKSVTPGCSNTRAEMEFKFVDKALKLMLQPLYHNEKLKSFKSQIHGYLSTLSQGRASEKLKRRLVESQEDTSHKRIRLEQSSTPVNSQTNMPAGPVSYTTLFNLLASGDPLEAFDIKELPSEIVTHIAFKSISRVNDLLLNNSVQVVQQRLKSLHEQVPAAGGSDEFPIDVDDQGDDQVMDNNEEYEDGMGDDDEDTGELMPASEFRLPEIEPISQEKKKLVVKEITDRLSSYPPGPKSEIVQQGINRSAVGAWTNDTWIVFASRLITRGVCGNSGFKDELRQHVYNYAMSDYRERLVVLLKWLTEEWYSEFVVNEIQDPSQSQYFKWVTKALDTIIPLTEKENMKTFFRLLSDLPELNRDLVFKIKSLCIDPDRIMVGFKGLQFLVMLRPPCRNDALDLIQELYNSDDEAAKEQAKGLLTKYRPEAL